MNDINNISDIIKAHSVVVENGSGVLIQPMTDKYSYILTAKHNLQVDPKNPKSKLKEYQDIKLITFKEIDNNPDLSVQAIHPHDVLDIAIIRIDFYSGLSISPYQNDIMIDDELRLYGYPGNRRHREQSSSQWMNNYKLEVQDPSRDKVTFRNASCAPQD